jgi:Ca-activated chloride channel family protein
MRVRWAAAALVFALSSTASGQFRSSAELVSVDVLVTDGRSPIVGLTAADFELTDNGIPQTVEQIYLEQLPLNVVMVLDSSASVRGDRLRALKAGALTVIDRLRPRDRAALVSFSHRLDLLAALTGDTASLRRSVGTLDADGSTALRDAAFAALALRTAEATRTLVLLFSDGLDTSSILSEDRVIEIARRSDAIVYTIGIRQAPVRRSGTGFRPGIDTPTDDRFLERLSRETAGRLLHAEQNRDIERTFARALDEFNTRYVLGYAPRGVTGSGWHRLEVRLKKRSGTVLARRGYFAE